MTPQEKRREYQRKYAEKRRRERGVKQWKGVEAACSVCGATYVRNGKNSKTCSPECATELGRARARKSVHAKARARGAPKIGDPCKCGHCGALFARDAARVKYCPDCRVLQKKGALPFMRDHFNNYRKSWHKDKMASDPVYAIKTIVRRSIAGAISRMGYTKRNRSYQILGCSWEFLKGYLEAKFQPGMTWENRGQWEVDHIVPISSAVTEDDVIRLNHYTNLQPLWASDNRSKGAKMDWQPEEP